MADCLKFLNDDMNCCCVFVPMYDKCVKNVWDRSRLLCPLRKVLASHRVFAYLREKSPTMRLLVLAVFFTLFPLAGIGQTQGWFTYDTTNSAIPSSIVTCVTTDSQNAIWVGTVNGIARFEDLFNWTIWNEANSDLPDNWINCIEVDNAGRMWIGTLSGGLSVFQNGTFTNYNTQNSPLSSNAITSINFDGAITWITTDGGGLYRFDGGSWVNYTSANSGFEIDVCYDVAVDGQGNKWVATLSDGLLKLSGSVFTGFNPTDSDIPFEFVRSLAVENDTAIWVGMGFSDNDSCLNRFNGSTSFGIFSSLNSNGIRFRNVWDILITDNNEKWICTNDLDHGVIKYNDTTFTEYSSFNSGLPINRVYGVAKDTGNYWFATFSGLSVFNENNATFSIAEPSPVLAGNIFPNPCVEQISIPLSDKIYQARVNLYASDGKWIRQEQLNQVSNGLVQMNTQDLASGFYFASVQAHGRTDYFKFIKQ